MFAILVILQDRWRLETHIGPFRRDVVRRRCVILREGAHRLARGRGLQFFEKLHKQSRQRCTDIRFCEKEHICLPVLGAEIRQELPVERFRDAQLPCRASLKTTTTTPISDVQDLSAPL